MENNIEKFVTPAAPGLDPVSVYLKDIRPGAGRVILVCFDMAWTGYWGAIGGSTIKDFFLSAGADYLEGNFASGRQYKRAPTDMAYLRKVINSAQAFVRKGGEA